MKIFKTNKYNMFTSIRGNRDIISGHVKKLMASIQEENLLDTSPIKVNAKYQVIDGQHRLAAAEKLGVSIYYFIDPDANLDTVIRTNTNNKNWGLQNFLDSFVKRGYESYQLLDLFCKQYSIPVSLALEVFEKNGSRRGDLVSNFKNGKFVIKQGALKRAEVLANNLLDYRKYVEKGVGLSRDFVRTVRYLYEKQPVSHREMIKKLEKMGSLIRRQGSAKEYLRTLEEIYNFRREKKNAVRFF